MADFGEGEGNALDDIRFAAHFQERQVSILGCGMQDHCFLSVDAWVTGVRRIHSH
jgi:hypothetical protein